MYIKLNYTYYEYNNKFVNNQKPTPLKQSNNFKERQHEMGNKNNQLYYSSKDEDKLQQLSNIKFTQNIDDPNFGNIDIYKNQQGKYLMMKKRTFMKEDTLNNNNNNNNNNKNSKNNGNGNGSGYADFGFHQILEFMREEPMQEFITPVLYASVKVENLCVIYQIIQTYTQYFNFTLNDMIRYKKEMDKEEIWLCFYWSLKLLQLMEEKGWHFENGSFDIGKVFLTLSGKPNISIHHIQANNTDIILKPSLQPFTTSTTSTTSTTTTTNPPHLTFTSLLSPSPSNPSPHSSHHPHPHLLTLLLSIYNLLTLSSPSSPTPSSSTSTNTLTQQQFFNGYQLYRRKIEKIDKELVAVFDVVVRKGFGVGEVRILVEELGKLGKIGIASQIKLNKFRYVIPKKQNTAPQKQPQPTKTPTSLHGRKTKSSSLRNSNKTPLTLQHIPEYPLPQDPLANLLRDPFNPTNATNSSPTKSSLSSLQTPMNRTMTIKNALLMDQIQNKKKVMQLQKQKLSQRKQQIMNMSNGTKNSKKTPSQSLQLIPKRQAKVYQGIGTNLGTNICGNMNKQNILGNSIREVRPSYTNTRKQLWCKKIVNQHHMMKQSYKKI